MDRHGTVKEVRGAQWMAPTDKGVGHMQEQSESPNRRGCEQGEHRGGCLLEHEVHAGGEREVDVAEVHELYL